jgi:uncharacterized membrane protein
MTGAGQHHIRYDRSHDCSYWREAPACYILLSVAVTVGNWRYQPIHHITSGDSLEEEGMTMSKADFFLQLRDRLRGLPYEEQQNIVHVYEDLFRQAEQSGKSELEIIQSLGYIPVPIQPGLPGAPSFPPKPVETGMRKIIAFIALGLFNLIFVLGPFIAVTALLFSFSLTAVLFMFSSVWIIIGTGIPDTFPILMLEICVAVTMTGLGVLLGIGLWKLDCFWIRLVKRYMALNIRLVKGD